MLKRSAISPALTTRRDCNWIKMADIRSMRFIHQIKQKRAYICTIISIIGFMALEQDEKIITFENYYDVMLAHIVRTKLEDNGIPCFIADENTLTANPLYNQAVGGIKLKIFERDLEKC